MDFLLALWLPILLAAAAVWVVSIILGMPFLHHKNDWIGLPPAEENALMEFLPARGIKPGNYLFPDFRDPKVMKSEKVEKALKQGPVGHLSVWPAPLTMGDKMVGSLLVHLGVCTLIAYLTRVAIPGPAEFARVFQFAAAAGVLAYCFSHIPSALWWGSYKRTIVANVIDGIVYGAIIGAIFAWRWPH